ncbi:MAG TPA: DUF2061 domain-containing protein [Methylovirgula sp.]|jgi:uncharacterized membrane protein|nr:DUF2061 domain-containing protein [Methylovirgula sp.]
MKSSMTLGLSLLAGAALIETALIPGLVIGGVAVLAPDVLSKFMPKKQRRARPANIQPSSNVQHPMRKVAPESATTAVALVNTAAVDAEGVPPAVPKFAVKQAIFKTITFRMIATTLDFTANMVVIGNLTTAAGLSAFGLIGAPLFYFGHELFWNRLAPTDTRVSVGMLMGRQNGATSSAGGLTMNRATAKTITYEIVVTTVDFTANFIATGDVVAAFVLTGFALVISPFIYYGHEKAWDYFGGRQSGDDLQWATQGRAPLLLAPA